MLSIKNILILIGVLFFSLTTLSLPAQATISLNNEYLLALSWQPAFCESKPYKIECQNQTEESFSANNLVLHGLWPQPRSNVYCNVSDEIKNKKWSQLPPLDLTPETREELAIKMPGYVSYLHRHEWYKHGTCYSETPEEYFIESMALLDQINKSDVRDLLISNINQRVNSNEIRDEFDDEFENQAGDKVKVSCNRDGDRTLLSELWINLEGEVEIDTSIEDLMENARDAQRGCSIVIVDPVGNQ